MKAIKLITVFPAFVDSPQRSFDESILRALRQSGSSAYGRKKALWIVDSLKLHKIIYFTERQSSERNRSS